MSRTRTRLELRTEVRQRADMVNSDFVTDNEINRYLNESISELYDMLISAKGQEWYIKTLTLNLVSGQADYDILETDNFYLLLGVDGDAQSDSPFPLRPYMLDERHDLTELRRLTRYGNVPNMRYRLSGTIDETTGVYKHRISFSPVPDSGTTVRLIYIPHAPVLDNDADVWDGFNGWEEYVVVDAAIKCLEKEESSTVALERRKERLIERIEGLASAHDDGFPERVTDVTYRFYKL